VSSEPSAIPPGASEAPPVVNVAWFLQQTPARRFGPLDEDEMRGYFRAGMVKPNDMVAVPGRVGFVSAAEAAALLGIPAPVAVAAPAATAFATSIIITPPNETRGSGALIAVGALVALAGLLYWKFHVPATLEQPTADNVADVAPASSPAAPRARTPEQLAFEASHAPVPETSGVEPTAPPAPPAEAPPAVSASTGTIKLAQPAPANTQAQAQASVDTWWTQAQALYDAQNWSGLIAHAGKWTAAEPRRDLAWWYLGLGHARSGNPSAAIEAYTKGLAISPNHYAMRWAMSDAYIATQRYRESLAIVTVLAKETPGDARLWNDIGIDQDNLGEIDDAAEAFQKAVQIDPSYRLAWGNLAKSYRHFGYLDKAKDAQAKADGR